MCASLTQRISAIGSNFNCSLIQNRMHPLSLLTDWGLMGWWNDSGRSEGMNLRWSVLRQYWEPQRDMMHLWESWVIPINSVKLSGREADELKAELGCGLRGYFNDKRGTSGIHSIRRGENKTWREQEVTHSDQRQWTHMDRGRWGLSKHQACGTQPRTIKGDNKTPANHMRGTRGRKWRLAKRGQLLHVQCCRMINKNTSVGLVRLRTEDPRSVNAVFVQSKWRLDNQRLSRLPNSSPQSEFISREQNLISTTPTSGFSTSLTNVKNHFEEVIQFVPFS